MNPAIHIDLHRSDVSVVRDESLPGGTWQRAFAHLLEHEWRDERELVYACEQHDPLLLALARCCSLLARRLCVFVPRGEPSDLLLLSADLGAEIRECSCRAMQDVSAAAVRYADKKPEARRLVVRGKFLCEALACALREALPPGWAPASLLCTSDIAPALAVLLPDTRVKSLEVDAYLAFELKSLPNLVRVPCKQKIWERARREPPFPSLSRRDAKLWSEAISGDVVWNSGRDYRVRFREEGPKRRRT